MTQPKKNIIIGLDGLGWNEIGEWVRDDTLSTMNDLTEGGTSTNLRSTHPPWTPCAWPSLLSGRNPGKHGVFDFFTRNGYDKHLIDRQDIDAPYIFEAADSQDLTTLAINYPVTHPASQLQHGAVIPGYLAQEDVDFYPKNLRNEYEKKYGQYIIYPEYRADTDSVNEYVSAARHRRNMAKFLDERYDWDLLAVQFQVTDSIFHTLDNRENIRQVLKKVDEFVGDIIELGGDDSTVFIVSDHGMGDYNWTFYVNSWLAQQGYCETTEGNAQYFRQEKDALKGKDDETGTSPLASTVKNVANTLSRVGITPQQIHTGLSQIGLASYVERILPEDALVAAQNRVVDHSNSIAYQLYFNSLGINLNVEGREPHGVVSEDEYEEVRSELIKKLEQVRDPDDNLVFDAVKPREEVYEGDHLEDAPDIALFPRDYRYDVSGSLLDTFRRYPHKNHKPEGILLSNRSLGDVEQADIYDVAPTIAAELGIPVDANTDGTVLTDVSEEAEREDWDKLAGEYVNEGESGDTSSVEERLADLGYME